MHSVSLTDIHIRNEIKAGDIGYITFLHGRLYSEEYQYGIGFEAYVARGLADFYEQFDSATSRVWVCKHHEQIVGFLALVNRGHSAQLRYFLLLPNYRGIGLGEKLMSLYMQFLNERGYKQSYLLTTHELHAAASLYRKHGFKLVSQITTTAFGKEVIEDRYEWNA